MKYSRDSKEQFLSSQNRLSTAAWAADAQRTEIMNGMKNCCLRRCSASNPPRRKRLSSYCQGLYTYDQYVLFNTQYIIEKSRKFLKSFYKAEKEGIWIKFKDIDLKMVLTQLDKYLVNSNE
ncbi:MAG: hypothetical protein AAGC93_23495 [Cyanobacteria bacterium P01_F01_bin.53]